MQIAARLGAWAEDLGLQELEYIEGDGKQYINTGITSTELNKSGAKLDCMFSLVGIYKYSPFIGTGKDYDFAVGPNNHVNNLYFRYSNGNLLTLGPPSTSVGKICHITLEDKRLCCIRNDGCEFAWTASTPVKLSGNKLYLLSSIYGFTAGMMVKARAYYCKICGENGVPLFDGVPVLDADGKPCMYDFVTQSCFYNPLGTDFIAGPPKTS